MYKLTFLFLLFSFYVGAQVIPIGTVLKGKRLPTLLADDRPDDNNNLATLFGSIKINDSKLSIVENGFVVLTNSDSRMPDISNASRYTVGVGIADFQITITTFASNTAYKYRAYAKNSKGEYAYSQLITFTTNTDFCSVNPCKNAATCTSTASGPLCRCTINFCGDCCVQLADSSCPGGGDQLCASYSSGMNRVDLPLIKIQQSEAAIYSWQSSQLATANQLSLSKMEK